MSSQAIDYAAILSDEGQDAPSIEGIVSKLARGLLNAGTGFAQRHSADSLAVAPRIPA